MAAYRLGLGVGEVPVVFPGIETDCSERNCSWKILDVALRVVLADLIFVI